MSLVNNCFKLVCIEKAIEGIKCEWKATKKISEWIFASRIPSSFNDLFIKSSHKSQLKHLNSKWPKSGHPTLAPSHDLKSERRSSASATSERGLGQAFRFQDVLNHSAIARGRNSSTDPGWEKSSVWSRIDLQSNREKKWKNVELLMGIVDVPQHVMFWHYGNIPRIVSLLSYYDYAHSLDFFPRAREQVCWYWYCLCEKRYKIVSLSTSMLRSRHGVDSVTTHCVQRLASITIH